MKTENNSLSVFQWLIYLLANSIAIPIVVGDIFQLSSTELSSLMQRVFFIVGLSSFIQAKFGHRYPIADGPAGSWVSIFVIYASLGIQQGKPLLETLQILESGILISGLILLLVGLTKWVRHLVFLFTPIVTGVFLLILAVQLSGVFLKGMVSTNNGAGQIDIVSLILSLFVFFLIILLLVKGKGWLKSYAILIGIMFGWIMFAILGKDSTSIFSTDEVLKLPKLFDWGLPVFNGSIMITAILFTFLLISNTIAAIASAEEAIPKQKSFFRKRLYSGIWAGGVSHIVASLFSSIAVVPLPATAGFVKITKQYRILPFLVACGILIVISVFPPIVGFLAALPLPVASAALLATLIEMYRIALYSLKKQGLTIKSSCIMGISIFAGIGTMFLSDEFFSGLPYLLQNICSNGLLVGTFMAISLELLLKRRRSSIEGA
ncbi:purine/pyrimidine permease [Bacillus sp. CGMCC 1.16607]|uniref:purine/pyrimidine permease n=1 Tax=Bacillus sp. CGMCC 1.16607 TaxID=3351842 RepID=UPI0036272767